MRLRVLSRAAVGVWGLWLTGALSEIPGLHACPVHDGPVAHAHAAHTMGEMADMAHSSESPAPADHSHHGAGCTCLGLCCCAPSVAPLASPVALDAALVVAVGTPTFADVAIPTVQRAHALPFANGPPTL